MIDPELAAKLEEISAKADAAYRSAEKVRKYLFWTGVVTIVLFVLPLIGLMFAIPAFMSSYVAPINAATGNTNSTGSIQQTIDTLNSLGL